MPQYKLLNSKGELVNTIVLEDDNDGWTLPKDYVLEEIVPEKPTDPPPRIINIISKLEFWKRFTNEERIATRTSTDPIIQDFVYMNSLEDYVKLDDPATINTFNQLKTLQILSEERADKILSTSASLI